ncbi:MAG: metal ABC transporter permease [Actinomycetota bacterium]
MNFLFGAFAHDHQMRLELLAGLLVAITCAITGTFVVLRGLSFIGDALAHGVLPGIAVAMLLGVSGMLGAAVSAVVMMSGVGIVNRRLRLSGDTAIGLLFVGMLSLGVLITSRSASLVGDLEEILFGDIANVEWSTIGVQAIALFCVATVFTICRRPFLLLSVDEGLVSTSGFSAKLFHNVMMAMVAITVIVSFQTVGTLLVMGMLIAPAATGALFARRISSMIMIAALAGSLSVYIGLLASYHYDLAAGASIVLTAVVIFAIAAIFTEVRKSIAHRHDDDHEHEHPHAHGHVHI